MTASSQAPSGEGLIGVKAVATIIGCDSCCASTDTYARDELGKFPPCNCERKERAQRAISAHLEALRAAGWKCVPIEPTPEMMKVAWHEESLSWSSEPSEGRDYDPVPEIWRAMIAASPPCNTKGETDGGQ